MPALISEYYVCVSNEPDCPDAFENVSPQYHNNNTAMQNLNVKICVRFAQRCYCGCGLTLILNNIPSPPLSSHCISRTEFLQNGWTFLRRYISHHLLSSLTLDALIPELMFKAEKYIDNYPSASEERSVVIPLCIDVIVELDANLYLEDVVGDYTDEIGMIPTSEEVIHALNKMKLEEGSDTDSNKEKECCICLEDFCDNVEVSTLPCQHVFHYNCVVKWLKTSHMCPLCRYQMPVGDDSYRF